MITGTDFNPNGDLVATIDRHGTCLISDLNTDGYRFHLNMEMTDKGGKQDYLIFIIFSIAILFFVY